MKNLSKRILGIMLAVLMIATISMSAAAATNTIPNPSVPLDITTYPADTPVTEYQFWTSSEQVLNLSAFKNEVGKTFHVSFDYIILSLETGEPVTPNTVTLYDFSNWDQQGTGERNAVPIDENGNVIGQSSYLLSTGFAHYEQTWKIRDNPLHEDFYLRIYGNSDVGKKILIWNCKIVDENGQPLVASKAYGMDAVDAGDVILNKKLGDYSCYINSFPTTTTTTTTTTAAATTATTAAATTAAATTATTAAEATETTAAAVTTTTTAAADKDAEADKPAEDKPAEDKVESPETGDSTVALFAAALVLSAAVVTVIVSKKRTA